MAIRPVTLRLLELPLLDERRKVNINVQIQLGVNEYAADLAGNSTELAQKILTAVGGDEEKDMTTQRIRVRSAR